MSWRMLFCQTSFLLQSCYYKAYSLIIRQQQSKSCMQKETLQIQKYLPRCYFHQLNLQLSIVAVVHRTNANKVMQLIKNSPSVLQKQTHLKRIRKKQENSEVVQVLLCLERQKEEKETIVSQISQYINELINVEIPFNPPQTKQEYQLWSQHWPINFIQQQIYKKIEHSKQEKSLILEISVQKAQLILFNDNKLIYSFETQKACCQGTIRHPVMDLLQTWPKTQAFNELPSAYYLTKLRMFCKLKICGMCAMALVHSRLERIYIQKANLQEKIAQILCNERLNHKVKIFLIQHSHLDQ